MIGRVAGAIAAGAMLMAAGGAYAQCASYPYVLANGTTADANHVMADFNCAPLLGQNNTFAGNNNFTGSLSVGVSSPTFKLDVQGGAALGGTTNNIGSNPDSFLVGLRSTGRLAIAWNASSGAGETDFISNRAVSRGGFRFYNYENTGTLSALMDMDGSTGNVSINVIGPSYTLQVGGTAGGSSAWVFRTPA